MLFFRLFDKLLTSLSIFFKRFPNRLQIKCFFLGVLDVGQGGLVGDAGQVPEFGVRIGIYPVEVCLEHYLRTGRRAGDLAEYRLEITSSAGLILLQGQKQ